MPVVATAAASFHGARACAQAALGSVGQSGLLCLLISDAEVHDLTVGSFMVDVCTSVLLLLVSL